MTNNRIATDRPAPLVTEHHQDVSSSTQVSDPRSGLTVVSDAVQELVATVESSDLARATPCEEFDVQALMDHITMVFRRSAAIGRGDHWTSVEQVQVGDRVDAYVDAVAAGAEEQRQAWSDPSRLGAIVEVPWGQLPGAAAVATYTAELATHGWDLATAIGRPFAISDGALEPAWAAVQHIPAEGRDTPEVPFSPVVAPAPGATLLLRIAGWTGRDVATN